MSDDFDFNAPQEGFEGIGDNLKKKKTGFDAKRLREMQKSSKGFSDLAGRLSQAAAQESPTKAAGGALDAVGDKLIETNNPYAVAAGAAMKMAAELVTVVDKVREFGKGLHESNMQFAEYSASMGMVQAESEMREWDRKAQQGENRADSAGKLAEAMNDLEDAMAPIEDAWAELKNELMTPILAVAADIVKLLSKLVGKDVTGEEDLWKGNVSGADAYQAAVERRAQARRPRRLGGGGGSF